MVFSSPDFRSDFDILALAAFTAQIYRIGFVCECAHCEGIGCQALFQDCEY